MSWLTWQMGVVLAVGVLVGSLVFVCDWKGQAIDRGYFLERPLPGEGEYEETLVVETPYGKQTVEVHVAEEQPGEEEKLAILKDVAESLDVWILGENHTRDEVRKPLVLVQELEDYPISLEWEVEEDGPLKPDGSLRPEKIEEEGTRTRLSAHLIWDELEYCVEFYVRVYPEHRDAEELFMEELQAELERQQESSAEAPSLKLPEKVSGQSVTWSRRWNLRGMYIVLLSMATVLWMRENKRSTKEKQEQERCKSLEYAYPEIVSKLKLYMEAGLSCRGAWVKMVEDYQKRKLAEGHKIPAYEEMMTTCFEMQSGVGERKAYERFGERLRIPCYKKLMGLLTQNTEKGTRGIGERLEEEMWAAFEMRKVHVKRRGEEAGTKLLFPMLGMLAVIIVIILAPALWMIEM